MPKNYQPPKDLPDFNVVCFGSLTIALDDKGRLIEIAIITGEHVTLAGLPAVKSRIR